MSLVRRFIFAVCLFLCAWATVSAEEPTRIFTDVVGRKVSIPTKINKVYCTSAVGVILIYTLSPDKLAGWTNKLGLDELKYITSPYDKLPVIGGAFGKNNSGSLEEIVKAHPDVIFSTGTADALTVSTSERLQTQTGIPVVILGSNLSQLEATYRISGDLLDAKDRATELADYCAKTLKETEEKVKAIPKEKRPRVYYAEGPRGLETDPSGSFHVELLDVLGAVNVAEVPIISSMGRSPVSMEQLLVWNPEIIISGYEHGLGPGGLRDEVLADVAWKNIAAVKNKKVFETPQYPFNWFDRPPSVNRILGIKWVAYLLYPDVFPFDMRKETSEFYEKFYRRKLTEQELDELLSRSLPRK
ncbi:TPA: ABC transporter substrate-binding protein [Candidatus Sumerlaeota bacterium]|jgi:iron complex transport system substrate-binding protein|nr:ABC transporter substrate-binding protein [Candidatus Sumerlaeota bacterium]